MVNLNNYTCCFFGHRKINVTEALKTKLHNEIETLILNEKVEIFLFGSKSEFDDLCYDEVSKLKGKYPHIKIVYVRAAYTDADRKYIDYLLTHYEDTYYPEKIKGAGKAAYVQRNEEMINKSKFCVIYFDKKHLPPRRKVCKRDAIWYQPKSGTAIAYSFAVKKKRIIINVYNT